MSDHFTCIGASALELAAMTPFLYAMQAREHVWDLHEALCGARVTTNYVRIGGLQSDLPARFAELCRARSCRRRSRSSPTSMRCSPRTRSSASAWKAPASLPADDADRVRRHRPAPACGRGRSTTCAGRIPTWSTTGSTSTFRWAPHGDNYDRYLVRVEEIRQSARIIEQCLRDLA